MIFEIDTLHKELDILNSEGTILGLYSNKDRDLVLKASIKGGGKMTYFTTDQEALSDYASNKIALNELYMRSVDLLVNVVDGKREEIAFKVNFDGQLRCGNLLYRDIAEGMKSRKFEMTFAN